MKRATLSAILLSTFLVSACGEKPPEEQLPLPAEPPAPRIRNVQDPAMDRGQEENREGLPEQGGVTKPVSRAESAAPSKPAGFIVDVAGDRVFLPGKGWLKAAEFWEIYYNHPQELPGNIDHQALQLLRAERVAE